ncbi:MAG: SAM-dependent methyltransferase, partial [Gammaproteobacteria bacterium]|nr:SAM-dependent methyltransferase [Gammaproteobacteria bacterium]
MDKDSLAKLYQNRFTEDQLPRKNAIWQVICSRFFQKYIEPGDTVVDLACGYGEFINNISAGEKIAIDLNPDSRGHLD